MTTNEQYMTRAKRTTLIIAIGALTFIIAGWIGGTADAISGPVKYGDSGSEVTEVQRALTDGGWPVVIDGDFGAQTHGMVALFQRANGLVVDGIVGPQTSRVLKIGYGATATAPAVRLTPVSQGSSTISGRCTQYEDELAYFSPGWDVIRMSQIMYRESRCRPDVSSSTGCCHGLLQLHQMHRPNFAVCGVTKVSDYFDPGKNICSAAVLYRRAGGMSPWRL